MDFSEFHFDIVIVAGQSNAEGNGIGTNPKERVVFSDQFEMIDVNKCFLDLSDYKGPKLVIKFPIETNIVKLMEKGTNTDYRNNIAIPFVDEYIKNGYLKKGRNILVINAGVGGTGFVRNEHGLSGPLYIRLCQMVNQALMLNNENRIVAFLWHQGECDAFENKCKSTNYITDFYYKSFIEQMKNFRSVYKEQFCPIIAGGFCDSWRNLPENYQQCLAVEKALILATNSLKKCGFVSADKLKSNMQEIEGSKDDIHFSRNSIFELGKRYFEKWTELIK